MVDQHHFIFLPGFMCDARLFDAQMSALTRAGHMCCAMDMTVADSIEDLAERILAKAPQTFVPVGLSMGGIVALELVRQAPDRVSHLALLNTTFHKDKAGHERLKQIDRVQAGELDLVLRDELKPRYMHGANRSPARLELLADMAASLGSQAFEAQTKALMERRSYEDVLGQVRCPTLILAGEDDTVCPPSIHREMASMVKGANLVVLSKCGHLSAMERPSEVSAQLLGLVAQEAPENGHRLLERTS